MECMACDASIDLTLGNIFYRLRYGFSYLNCDGVQFEEDCFEDGSRVKWLCMDCAQRCGLNMVALDEEFCTLCMEDFGVESESASVQDPLVRVEELLIRDSRTGIPAHDLKDVGNLHFFCTCEAGVPLESQDFDRDVPCP